MSNPNLAMSADGGPDDLPRTLRREKEAREREARERDARERGTAMAPVTAYPSADPAAQSWSDEAQPAVVTALRVPFFRLMLFFIKAVFAAIPALIILGVLLWTVGHVLQTYFPWIVKMRILIHFPG
jgi:hypothetical protein